MVACSSDSPISLIELFEQLTGFVSCLGLRVFHKNVFESLLGLGGLAVLGKDPGQVQLSGCLLFGLVVRIFGLVLASVSGFFVTIGRGFALPLDGRVRFAGLSLAFARPFHVGRWPRVPDGDAG